MPNDQRAHDRIDNVEVTLNVLRNEQQALKHSLETNTKMTEQVVTNTADMVDLLKGGKVATRFFLWFVSLAGAVAFFFDHWNKR